MAELYFRKGPAFAGPLILKLALLTILLTGLVLPALLLTALLTALVLSTLLLLATLLTPLVLLALLSWFWLFGFGLFMDFSL